MDVMKACRLGVLWVKNKSTSSVTKINSLKFSLDSLKTQVPAPQPKSKTRKGKLK